ncbi:MAG TPA: DUF72 domain-containing protein [Phnomibacter sp.]|nr:DUF72 domain-containing protein [Phnomibacter sp.]
MKFGSIDTGLLQQTDMSLPEDGSVIRHVLPGVPAQHPQLFLGCTQWKCDAWLGKIYPPKIKDNEILDTYIRQFNAIEMNAMHYRIFSPDMVSKWAAKAAGTPFRFCPKFPQSISHYSSFTNASVQTAQFIESIEALKEHLGPAFLQVGDALGLDKREQLFTYLAALPKQHRFFVELRHPDWFSAPAKEATATWLAQHGIGWVITDVPGRRDVCHMQLTTPVALVRFLGNNLHPTDYKRIDAWIIRIKHWLTQGLEQLYFFMHHPEEEGAPELIDYMAQRLQLQTGIPVKRPTFLPKQATMF